MADENIIITAATVGGGVVSAVAALGMLAGPAGWFLGAIIGPIASGSVKDH